MDLYDRIKMLSQYQPEIKRKRSKYKDPKQAALEDMLRRAMEGK